MSKIEPKFSTTLIKIFYQNVGVKNWTNIFCQVVNKLVRSPKTSFTEIGDINDHVHIDDDINNDDYINDDDDIVDNDLDNRSRKYL